MLCTFQSELATLRVRLHNLFPEKGDCFPENGSQVYISRDVYRKATRKDIVELFLDFYIFALTYTRVFENSKYKLATLEVLKRDFKDDFMCNLGNFESHSPLIRHPLMKTDASMYKFIFNILKNEKANKMKDILSIPTEIQKYIKKVKRAIELKEDESEDESSDDESSDDESSDDEKKHSRASLDDYMSYVKRMKAATSAGRRKHEKKDEKKDEGGAAVVIDDYVRKSREAAAMHAGGGRAAAAGGASAMHAGGRAAAAAAGGASAMSAGGVQHLKWEGVKRDEPMYAVYGGRGDRERIEKLEKRCDDKEKEKEKKKDKEIRKLKEELKKVKEELKKSKKTSKKKTNKKKTSKKC